MTRQFSRRALSLRPVHSEKVEQIHTRLAADNSTVQEVIIAKAVRNPTADLECEIGSTISSVYVEFNTSGQTVTNPSRLDWLIQKSPSGVNAVTPNQNNPVARRFIFKRGIEMFPSATSTVFKRIFVVRIPPRFKRMGEADELLFRYINSSSQTMNMCAIFIHKVFF